MTDQKPDETIVDDNRQERAVSFGSFVKTDNETVVKEYELDSTYSKTDGKTKVVLTTKRLYVDNSYDMLELKKENLDLGNAFIYHEIPVKQIGTCHICNEKRTVKRGNPLLFILFMLIFAATLIYIVFTIKTKGFKNHYIDIVAVGMVSAIVLTFALYNIPRRKKRRYLYIYVESSKEENSLILGNIENSDGVKLKFTRDNFNKLVDIFHSINEIRK